MQYAYFDPITRKVLSWLDTKAFENVLPDSSQLVRLSQAEWEAHANQPRWVTESQSLSPYAPEVLVSLDQIKANKMEEINAACAAEIVGGFTSDALGATHVYPSQVTDQSNLMAAVLSSLSSPAEGWETPVWCMDATSVGAYRMHTAAQVQTVGNDSLIARNAAIAKKSALQSRISQAVTTEQVSSSNWPAI